jgi:hypothetical protein
MNTAVLNHQAIPQHRPNRLYDRIFFATMDVLLLATVLFGFGHTYYFAGRTAPNLLIHIHGAAFASWMILLFVQTALISAKKIRIHRRLGIFGFCLAVCMVLLGVSASIDSLRRAPGILGLSPESFFIIPISDMLVFSTLIFLAFYNRTNPVSHKRYILIGSITLMGAAIARWPLPILKTFPPFPDVILMSFLLLIVAFDLFSTRRIQRSTLIASAVMIFVHAVRFPFAATPLWQHFAHNLRYRT